MAQIAVLKIRGLGAADAVSDLDKPNLNFDSLGYDNSNITTVSMDILLPGQEKKETHGDSDAEDSE